MSPDDPPDKADPAQRPKGRLPDEPITITRVLPAEEAARILAASEKLHRRVLRLDWVSLVIQLLPALVIGAWLVTFQVGVVVLIVGLIVVALVAWALRKRFSQRAKANRFAESVADEVWVEAVKQVSPIRTQVAVSRTVGSWDEL